ncbi:MAG: GNAT family N-acetyltransferase [Fimbriimonadales bacterium]
MRLPRRGDEEAMARFYSENRRYLQPFSPTLSEELFTIRGWRGRIDATLAEYRSGKGLRLVVFPRDRGQGAHAPVIGVANFTSITSFPGYSCNLGYSIAEAEQGKGLMTEALRAAIDYVFGELRLHRIEANYMPRNAASARVLEKLGFTIEGLAKDYLLIDGRWEDHVRTSLTNTRWNDE